MIINTESGATYITTPKEGEYVLINTGVSEVFDLTVLRPAGEPGDTVRTFTDCFWLAPVVVGQPVDIQRSDAHTMWSTNVVSIDVEMAS